VFSYARTINPTENDVIAYQQFVDAAVIGHVSLGLTITPKAHLMLKHVWWQMKNIPGGLGDKWRIGWRSSIKWASRNEHNFVQ
jgi:hypothetical protein